ncbi:hypothetical protein ACLB2K_019587 [Fragaria x ananassa]
MVNRHKLHNKDWVNMMYEKRHLWAEAFVSGHFFTRMRSTQRCEGMHSYMKPYLKSGVKLFELVPALDRGLLRLRFKGVLEDFKSNNSTHVLTSSLRNLEHHAVLKRWTKSAKVDMQTSFSEGEVPKESIEFARYDDLNCFGSKLCNLASKTKEGTDILNKEFMRLEPILSD